jgi:hypothetical protein
MIEDINIKIKNLELRKASEDFSKYEIVKWVKSDRGDYCYTIAFIDIDKRDNEFDVRSAGMRPWDLKKEEKEYFDNLIRIFNFIIRGKFISDAD